MVGLGPDTSFRRRRTRPGRPTRSGPTAAPGLYTVGGHVRRRRSGGSGLGATPRPERRSLDAHARHELAHDPVQGVLLFPGPSLLRLLRPPRLRPHLEDYDVVGERQVGVDGELYVVGLAVVLVDRLAHPADLFEFLGSDAQAFPLLGGHVDERAVAAGLVVHALDLFAALGALDDRHGHLIHQVVVRRDQSAHYGLTEAVAHVHGALRP